MANQTNRLSILSAIGEQGRNQPGDTLEIGSSWKTIGTGTFDFGSTGAINSSGIPASFTMGTVGAISLTAGAASLLSTSVGALTLTSATAATWSTGAGALTLTGAGALILTAAAGGASLEASAGAIDIGSGSVTGAIRVGTGGDRNILIGNSGGASNITLMAGTGSAVTVSGGLTVANHLLVQGGVTMIQSSTMRVAASHVYQNDGYTTALAHTGGLVVNYLPTATATTVAAGGFTAGVGAVSNPTVATVGAATFTAGDVVQISGASSVANGGLFEVSTHALNVLTIRGVGTDASTQDWVQSQFTTDVTVAGTLTKVNVAVVRAGIDGVFETALGQSTTGLTFADLLTTASVVSGKLLNVRVLTAGSSYAKTAGTSSIWVGVVAGGGGGGGVTSIVAQAAAGAGGASGGITWRYYTSLNVGPFTYAIGAGGAGGANTGGAGGAGGDTTFTDGSVLITAKGGLGGPGQTASAAGGFVQGGAGVIGTNGDINQAGAPGALSIRLSGTLATSGSGGSNPYGGGGAGLGVTGAGLTGIGFGSGGGGALCVNGSGAALGGIGAAGLLIVFEYS